MVQIDLTKADLGWDWSSVGSGLVGALVGGVFALLGVMLAAHFAKRHAEAVRRKLVLGGVRAITAELAVNFARYEAMAAPAIRRVADGERMNFHWPIREVVPPRSAFTSSSVNGRFSALRAQSTTLLPWPAHGLVVATYRFSIHPQ